MVSAKGAVTLVVALFVGAIMAGALMPTAIGGFAGAESQTISQDTGDTDELQPGLNVTLDSVTDGVDATYTVEANGDSETVTVDSGQNDTVTVDGADVTITPDTIGASSATTMYEYPTDYGWGSAGALWGIMGIIVLLPIVLYFVKVSTDAI